MVIRRAIGMCLVTVVLISVVAVRRAPAQTAGIDNIKQLAGKWEGRGARGRTAGGGGGTTVWNVAEDGSVTGMSGINNAPITGRIWLQDGKIYWQTEGAGGGGQGTFTLTQDSAGKKTLTGEGRANRGGQMLNWDMTKSE